MNLALRLCVPALLVSLTIVSFGTSAPELFISVDSVLAGSPGIAMGNVVGSNVANVLLVLGVPAILAGISCAETDTKRSYLTMLGATVFFIVLCLLGPITWLHGVALLAALALILWDQGREAIAHAAAGGEEEEPEGADPKLQGWRIGMFLVLGLIGLPVGADLFVDSSVRIAYRFGVSETVIGLTLVALGTSLPELATTVAAALRREADVALGNVIGSNMFNLLAIIGVASFFGAMPVDPAILRFDLWAMLGASLLLIPFVLMRKDITRVWGVALTALYAAYIALVIM